MFLCLVTLASCEMDPELEGGIKEDAFFRIVEFNSSDGAVDLNNDAVLNSDMLLELPGYYNATYDLEIKTDKNSSLLSFYLPKQNIFYDYPCCPGGFVEFSRNGFTISRGRDQASIFNSVIDDETTVNSFIKSDEDTYILTMEKEYFDFNTNVWVTRTFEVKYRRTE